MGSNKQNGNSKNDLRARRNGQTSREVNAVTRVMFRGAQNEKFGVLTLVMHGENDQTVAVKDLAKKSTRLIKGANQDQVNADLLACRGKKQRAV